MLIKFSVTKGGTNNEDAKSHLCSDLRANANRVLFPKHSTFATTDDEKIAKQSTLQDEKATTIVDEADFDMSKSLATTEAEIIIDMKTRYNIIINDILSSEYYEALTNYEDIPATFKAENRSKAIEFSEFATIYRSRMTPYQIGESGRTDYENARAELLSKKYQEIKIENDKLKQRILQNEDLSKYTPPVKSSLWVEGLATDYALTYGLHRNSDYFGFPNDCTNFASQIARAGGAVDDYGDLPWYYSNITAHSKSWTVANLFVEYWLDIQGASFKMATSHSQLLSNVKVGDFIGFERKNSGEFHHIAYCTKKTSGEVYYTQHTINAINKHLTASILDDWGDCVSFRL